MSWNTQKGIRAPCLPHNISLIKFSPTIITKRKKEKNKEVFWRSTGGHDYILERWTKEGEELEVTPRFLHQNKQDSDAVVKFKLSSVSFFTLDLVEWERKTEINSGRTYCTIKRSLLQNRNRFNDYLLNEWINPGLSLNTPVGSFVDFVLIPTCKLSPKESEERHLLTQKM